MVKTNLFTTVDGEKCILSQVYTKASLRNLRTHWEKQGYIVEEKRAGLTPDPSNLPLKVWNVETNGNYQGTTFIVVARDHEELVYMVDNRIKDWEDYYIDVESIVSIPELVPAESTGPCVIISSQWSE